MRKTIFDLISKNIDFRNEYERISSMIFNDKIICFDEEYYTYIEIFNKFIEDWKYRGICTNFNEIADNIGLTDYPSFSAEEACLYLIELILNIREFLLYKKEMLEPNYENYNRYGLYYDAEETSLIINDKILYDNIMIILNELGYSYIKKEEYKIVLVKENADATNTALIVEDESISDTIMQYNDFRIVNNLNAKREILLSLGQYIEPLRKDIKNKNSELEDYIFFCLNKLHIRHNNKSGKKSNEYVAIMKDEELIKWYDKVYNLILIAIRLIELPKEFNEFKELKSKIIEADELFKNIE